MYRMHYFPESNIFSCGSGSFLALLVAGHAAGPSVHHGASVVGPVRAPWCRALGAQSRKVWRVPTGSLSEQLEPTRPMQSPKTSFFNIHPSLLLFFQVPQQPSKARQPRYNSRASSLSLCDSHERCFCAWVRERACHCRILQQQERGTVSGTWKCHSIFLLLFFIFWYDAVCCCCCVPVPHRELSTMW